ncbi:MAG: CbiX/SirB N-terminal domain-containing protein [Dermatophilaceae bacterium]
MTDSADNPVTPDVAMAFPADLHVVLLAHGSPDPRHGRDVARLASAVGRRFAMPVHLAYLDHHGPSVTGAGAPLMDASGLVVLVPVLLTRAFHTRVDVPAAAATLARASGRPIVTTAALGPDPLIGVALGQLLGDPPPDRVLIYLAGSSQVAAVDEVVAGLGPGLPAGVVSAAATVDDRLPLAVALERLGGPDGVVAVSCMIAGGVLRDRMARRCALNGIPLRDGVLADTDALADLVGRRVGESLSAPRS